MQNGPGGLGATLGRERGHAEKKGFKSQICRRKPKGKPMPKRVSGANAKRSRTLACVERAFADR